MSYNNQNFNLRDDRGANLTITKIPLNIDKEISLLRVFEEDASSEKKYIRNELVLIGSHILTSRFSDTLHFFEEIKLFDHGNDQNKYIDITEHKRVKNLRLKYDGDKNIYISKSEANTMYKLLNLSFMGYSLATVLEQEFILSEQKLTQLLHDNNFFVK